MSQIQYTKPLTFLFGYKEWANRLLFGSLIFLIPIVGPIIIMGWAVKTMHARIRGDETLPLFDDIGDLLDVGLMPFLAQLVAMLPFMLFGFALSFGGIFLVPLVGLARHSSGPSPAMFVVGGVMGFFVWLCMIAYSVFLQGMMIRVEVTGKFGEAFRIAEVVRFTKQHFKQIILGSLIIGLLSPFVIGLGWMACVIGMYPAMFIITIATGELRTQIYRRHLALGGEPIATTSYFNDQPLHLGPEI